MFSIQICGKMKDELASKCMTKFIGLRPKLYSFEFLDKDGCKNVKNTAKGVQKSMKNRLTFNDYESCLANMNTKIIQMNRCKAAVKKLRGQALHASGRRESGGDQGEGVGTLEAE